MTLGTCPENNPPFPFLLCFLSLAPKADLLTYHRETPQKAPFLAERWIIKASIHAIFLIVA